MFRNTFKRRPLLRTSSPLKPKINRELTLRLVRQTGALHKGALHPDLNSANIAYKLLAKIGGAETIGPILMGMSRPVHLLARGADVEEIVNVAAIAVVDAQENELSADWKRRESIKPRVAA